jgi:hypothetical protein
VGVSAVPATASCHIDDGSRRESCYQLLESAVTGTLERRKIADLSPTNITNDRS